MGAATHNFLLAEYGFVGAGYTLGNPCMDGFRVHGLAHVQRGLEEAYPVMGLDCGLFCLAIHAMEQHFTLSITNLSTAGDYCSLVSV